MIDYALVALLEKDIAVRALASDRIYPIRSPQNAAYPNITYRVSNTQRNRHLGGHSGHTRTTFKVDCWARSQKVARQLAKAVRLAVDNFRGTEKDVSIQVAFVQDEQDNWEFEFEGSDTIFGRVTLDIVFRHGETVPSR